MLPLIDIFNNSTNFDLNFNPKLRDSFVLEVAAQLIKSSKVLDISSGSKPYKNFFDHCKYTSHEFVGNKEIIDDFRMEKPYNKEHDIYSEIDNIPVLDDSFDFILCTEVFEHIPEPINAMKEFVRICKPGGQILITAPFSSGVHQEPYHFYSGFSPFFYNYLKKLYNLKIIKFKSQGDIFLLNHQEIKRVFQFQHPIIQENLQLKQQYESIISFILSYTMHMSELCKSELEKFDDPNNMLSFLNTINKFTIGYCVLFEKPHIENKSEDC